MEIPVLVWIACGVLIYGQELAFWQRRYPELAPRQIGSDVLISIVFALFGPLGLTAGILGSALILKGNPFQHGLKFNPWSEI